MLNTCFIENKIPKIWRQSKIVAILNPGKDSVIPKNYRQISLLCHTYKLYERLILNRVSLLLEQHLIKEQAASATGSHVPVNCLTSLSISKMVTRGMITGAVLSIHRSRNYHWRCTGRTHTVAPNGDSLLVVGVSQSRGLQIVSTSPASPEARPPRFLGEASRASPQHGWRSAYSLRETLSPTQDQNQH